MNDSNTLKVALAQIAPVWLNKHQTLDKIKASVTEAVAKAYDLVVFGEGILQGYPFWLSLTNSAQFNSAVQNQLHAHYRSNAVRIEAGELEGIGRLAGELSIGRVPGRY
jgi:nitrilase